MLQVGTGDGLVELGVDGSVVRRALGGTEVTMISGDWAIADDAVVSLDDGVVRALPDGLRPRCLLALAGGRALVGTTEARLVLVGGPDGPATDRAFDDIPTRDGWSTPWGAPADLRSLTMAGTRPLAGVHVGGVWRRDDDGWIEIVPAEADDHQVIADEDVIAVAAAIGVGQRVDGPRHPPGRRVPATHRRPAAPVRAVRRRVGPAGDVPPQHRHVLPGRGG